MTILDGRREWEEGKEKDIKKRLYSLARAGSAAVGTAVRMLDEGLYSETGGARAAFFLRIMLEGMKRDIDFLIPYLMELEESPDEPEPETVHG